MDNSTARIEAADRLGAALKQKVPGVNPVQQQPEQLPQQVAVVRTVGPQTFAGFLRNNANARAPANVAKNYDNWKAKLSYTDMITLMLAAFKHNLNSDADELLAQGYENGVYGTSGPTISFRQVSTELKRIMNQVDNQGNKIPAPDSWAVITEVLKTECQTVFTELLEKYHKPRLMKMVYSRMVLHSVSAQKVWAYLDHRIATLFLVVDAISRSAQISGPPDTEDQNLWIQFQQSIIVVPSSADEIAIKPSYSPEEIFAGVFCPRPHEMLNHPEMKAKLGARDPAAAHEVAKRMGFVIDLAVMAGMKVTSKATNSEIGRMVGKASISFDSKGWFMQWYNASRQYLQKYCRYVKKYPAREAAVKSSPTSARDRAASHTYEIVFDGYKK